MKLSLFGWSLEIIYEKIEDTKSIFIFCGHDQWKSKRTYAFYRYNEYTKNNPFKKFKDIRIMRWPEYLNLSGFYIDINKYNIPFMFHFIF